MAYKGLKWAIGIITWERPEIFKVLTSALEKCVDVNTAAKIVIADDASKNPEKLKLLDEFKTKFPNAMVLKFSENGGVAVNSNRALKVLRKFDFGFLMNDDYMVIKTGVFHKYMDAFLATGIHSFQHNISGAGKRIEYNGVPLVVTSKSYGGLITVSKSMLKNMGGFDFRVGKFGFEHRLFTLKAKKRGFVGDPNTNVFYDIPESRVLLKRNESGAESTAGKSRYKGFADKWKQVKEGVYKPYFGDEVSLETEKDKIRTAKEKFGKKTGVASPQLASFVDALSQQEELPIGLVRSGLSLFGAQLKKLPPILDQTVDNPNRDLVTSKHMQQFNEADFSKIKGHENRAWLYFAIGTFWGGMFGSKMQQDVLDFLKSASFHSSRYAWIAFTMIPEPDAKRFFKELLANAPEVYERWLSIAAKRLMSVGKLTDFVKDYKLPLRFVPTVTPSQKVKFLRILYSPVVDAIASEASQDVKESILVDVIKKTPFDWLESLEDAVEKSLADKMKTPDIDGASFSVKLSDVITTVKNMEVGSSKVVDKQVHDLLKSGVGLDLGQEALKFYKTIELISNDEVKIDKIELNNGGTNTTFKGNINGTPMFFKVKRKGQQATSPIVEVVSNVMTMLNIKHPKLKKINLKMGQLGGVEIKDSGIRKQSNVDVEVSEFVQDFVTCSWLSKPLTKERDRAQAIIDNLSGESIKKLAVVDFITYQQDRFIDNVGVNVNTGEVIPMDNDLAYGYMPTRAILTFMIRDLAYDIKMKRDEKTNGWIEKVFIPAFDYRTYGEIGVNYPPEVIKMLDDFSTDGEALMAKIIPKENVRPEIVDAIKQNLRNMIDFGFETAVIRYKMDIMPKVVHNTK